MERKVPPPPRTEVLRLANDDMAVRSQAAPTQQPGGVGRCAEALVVAVRRRPCSADAGHAASVGARRGRAVRHQGRFRADPAAVPPPPAAGRGGGGQPALGRRHTAISRTTLSGPRAYYRRYLTELEQACTPVHRSLFDELEHAERYLGPPQPVYTRRQEGISDGVHISMGVAMGERRAGFEMLRDIITRHRQGWSHRYLAEYLRHRWKSELIDVAYELNKFVAELPTFKQFARFAAKAANHWFNGDLAGLYAAIGERAPTTSRRVDLLPGTAHDFVDAVYAALGAPPYEEVMRDPGSLLAAVCRQKARLAGATVCYVQIAEALGGAPEATEFGADRHEWEWAGGLERGWPVYRRAVEAATLALASGAEPGPRQSRDST
ncbi:hypothetical protein [Nonomuraea sp. NPDC049480]|uniref:hypothetical protein n=1 Tax=Nonomuraea sp. NPDC049480 TaxID=3364353 RepID=UPI003792A833